ncbi:ribosome recycling factor [Clostridium algoriphilum]|uniref:ribosome recycling factor n=1 Tax=Clostridium algoriphilum TaxID=198347 RepID=UPI001CF59055|nr:ribosome recycling factor [Clostridium algoriphilum]MCB2292079.1 ribosome recycling factor [Clostridium algoriphilum]
MIKEIISIADEKMNKSITVLKHELASLKAGRANVSMLDRIRVESYGSLVPVSQVANVSSPEPRVLLIQPWDKASMKDIEKAILKSDLGLNPSNDGSAIRLIIPELTEETRKNLIKVVKKTGEEAKVAIRSIRRDANDKIKGLKKSSEITDDEAKKSEDIIQKETDKFIKELDKLIDIKEKEIMLV